MEEDEIQKILADQNLSFDKKMAQISTIQNQKKIAESIEEIKRRCLDSANMGETCAQVMKDEELYALVSSDYDNYQKRLNAEGLYLIPIELTGICIRWEKPVDYPEASDLPSED